MTYVKCLCGKVVEMEVVGQNIADGMTRCEKCKRRIVVHFRKPVRPDEDMFKPGITIGELKEGK